jgi:SecD/SecF fusion protein
MSDRRRNLFVLLLVLGLIAASAVVVATKPTKLGLDLQGGVQLVYQGKPTAQQKTITAESIDRALDIMRQRVDAFGVAEPELARVGKDLIEVSLPGVKNAERAAQQVGTTAQLYFYDWENNLLNENCKIDNTQINGGTQQVTGLYNAVKQASKCTGQKPGPESAGPRFYAFDKVSKRPFNNGQPSESREEALADLTPAQRERAEVIEVPPGVVVVRAEKAGSDAPPPDASWILRDRPALGGTDIKNPEQSFDQQAGNEPIVKFDLTGKGRKAFQNITRQISQRGADNAPPAANPQTASQHFAIVLDNELVSAPFINYRELPDGIDGSTGAQISGGFTIQSAQDLAKILKIGALPIRLDLISRSQVSATLGKQALHQGLIAGVAGFVIVVLFLIAYYRLLGLIAAFALGVYALYFYAIVKLIPVTLTLPGIAGLILTLGVAADANIVIFERVKEELRAGRSVGSAITTGYRKGLTAIADANIVTFLVAFILFILATAGVKGFAFMLGLGVIVSVLTAVIATQAFLYSLRNTSMMRSKHLIKSEQRFKFQFDFTGASKWFFSMSGLILLVGALAIAGKGINFGIDFESGTRITAALQKSATVNDVRKVLDDDGYGDAKIQTVSNAELGRNVVQISTPTLEPPQVDKVTDSLREAFGVAQQPEVESIGPTFGKSIANSAIIAIIASLTVITIYIALRFEWKFAVPVLIALMHDILIVSGVYALTGREVTTSTVAALLTILGYSLYDTIIVFDRVRENIPRMPAATFSQISNRSMSEVLTRSLATSFCTLLPVLALYFFGGETLQDFAFALIVGIASGTYSSVFIATPVLVHWKEREPVYRAREKRVHAALGYVPAYATAIGGEPVDVAPKETGRRGRLTAPADPAAGVSRAEFEDMVKDLGLPQEPAAAAPGPARPTGGRRARSRGNGPPPPAPPAAGADSGGSSPAEPPPKPKKPRKKPHGRSR